MTSLYLRKLRLQKPAIVKPLLIHHIAVKVIMQDLDLPVILSVEYESLVIALGVMSHHLTYYTSQAFTSVAHIRRIAADVIFGSRCEVNHG